MVVYYWLGLGNSPSCDPEAKLEPDLYHSEANVSAFDYFKGLGGDPGMWTMYYDKQPCDITNGVINFVVSQKFKDIADSLKIDAEYHPVTAMVGGSLSSNKYYLPKPAIIDFLDKDSESVDVIPEDEIPAPGWIENVKFSEAPVYASKLDGIHWASHAKMFGSYWIISEEFKSLLDSENITAPRTRKANVISD